MSAAALYEPPFVGLNVGGPEAVFDGKAEIIDGIFARLGEAEPKVEGDRG